MRGSAAFRAAIAPGGVLAGPWVKNELWRRAKAVPSLDLRFADNKSLTDAVTGQSLVTFTRASSGTYVGSDGVLRTATTNLLLRSEEFDNASWSKSNASVTEDSIASPSGQQNADKLVENTAASTGHYVNPAPSPSITSGQSYVFSVFAKAAERTFVQLILTGIGPAGANVVAGFDLTTGSAGSPNAGSSSIQSFKDGWYRCSLALTASTTASTLAQIRLAQSTTSSPSSYTGDGTSGVYLWGAQLEQSSTVGEYIPTTSTINSAPRFDHNPTTGESLGLLVEEQRTNLLLQSNMFDTTWINNNSSETASAGTAPDGTNTAWELKDTSDASAAAHSLTQSVPFTSGTTYTFTVWMKAGTLNEGGIAVPLAAFGAVLINRINLSTGAVISTSANSTTVVTPFGNGWYRIALTATATATASSSVQIRPMNGGTTYIGTGTGTVLVWGAQLEAGAFPTSYIPTTTATVTRSADVASISGSAFSSWYRQDEGTVFAEGSSFDARTNDGIFLAVFDDNSISNEININRRIASYLASFAITTAGVTQADIFGSAWQTGSIGRCAGAFKANDAATSFNGGTVATDAAVTVPTVNTLRFGRRANGFNVWNGTIRRLTYWPQRLSNSTLQAITQ